MPQAEQMGSYVISCHSGVLCLDVFQSCASLKDLIGDTNNKAKMNNHKLQKKKKKQDI